MSEPGTAAQPEADRRLALILVRNAVTHDARVLREAQALRGSGYEVAIAGVVSGAERDRTARIDGTPVIRLDPAAPAAGLWGALRRRAMASAGSAAVADDATGAADLTGGAGRPAGPYAQLRRLVVTGTYYLQGIRLVLRTSPALVHANDYNTMWIGVAAKVLRRSRLVYDSHELWSDRNGRPEWRPWLLACEALFVWVADATVTSSPGYAQALSRRYRMAPPIVIRNIPAARLRGAAPRRAPAADPRLAVYVGGLMRGRGLEQAIDALSHARDARLRLIGPGHESYRKGLQRRAELSGVAERVELLAPVGPDAVLDAIADAAIGLMLIQPACLSYELTLPNKLFEYAAAGLPILASDLAVIGPLVRAEGIGEAVPGTDVELIAQAIERLLDPAVNARLRKRVRLFAARNTWESERHALERVYGATRRLN